MDMTQLKTDLTGMHGINVAWVGESARITMGDGTDIYLEYLPEQDELYFYSHVASISEKRFGKFAVALLKANLFGKDTGGSAVMAYDADEGKVVLWDKLSLSACDESEFHERLYLLYLSVLHWAAELRQDLITGDLNDIDLLSASITG